MITQAEAARRAGVSRQAIDAWKKENPVPSFFIENEKGKLMIDENHPEWKAREQELILTIEERKAKGGRKRGAKKKNKNDISEAEIKKRIEDMAGDELAQESVIAVRKKLIFEAKIKEEQAKQAEIKTKEKMKNLAPYDLLEYWFSFSENLYQRIYSRPKEIFPQMKAFIMGNEDRKAIQFLIRELEAVIVDAKKDLINDLKKEGFPNIKEKKK